MDQRTTTDTPSNTAEWSKPDTAEWAKLGERIEDAIDLASDDPEMALAQFEDIKSAAADHLTALEKQAVMEARRQGKSWQEIAAATGVKDRQSAWKRWTDEGVPRGISDA
jgi:DNA-directed RNA polymerase specialized sigma24 family protein